MMGAAEREGAGVDVDGGRNGGGWGYDMLWAAGADVDYSIAIIRL